MQNGLNCFNILIVAVMYCSCLKQLDKFLKFQFWNHFYHLERDYKGGPYEKHNNYAKCFISDIDKAFTNVPLSLETLQVSCKR